MQSFNSWISQPLQNNLVVFEDGSECGAIKYKQINQSLMLLFVALQFQTVSIQLFHEYGVFYILLRVSRIVHSLRNVLAKLV